MDELLPLPKSSYLPSPVRAKEKSAEAYRGFSLPRPAMGITLPNFMERRTKAGPAIFLTLALAVSSTAVLTHMYSPCVSVSVDGVDMGLIQSRQLVESAQARVENRASRILGYEYTLEQEITYEARLALEEDISSVSGVETYLFDQIGEVMQTSVLTVNGQTLGATDSAEGLQELLNSISGTYVTENTISVNFVENVNVSREYSPTDDIVELSDLAAILTSNTEEQVDYVVQSGDTFSGIAYKLDMSMSELKALNPDVNIDRLQIGQVLTVSQAVPFLSVRTIDNETYEGAVDYEVERIPDDTMYQGTTKVITEGVDGTAIYNADVTYINGTEQDRVINSMEVLTEPVTQVEKYGTKERPKTMATGTFRWPVSGTITSTFGNRYIFGSYSYHSGIDIATAYGTTIVAADGGKVIYSGNRGTGYGNYVVIDHENGLQTYYAHCSSLIVSVGERVYKGQAIARVGSTGKSTGNHCHFEVRKNGTAVNPYNYLP